ncbi:helix-turn-helix transcriptional regulator [Gordonia sp. DT30]|uniref:helix-turn-helix transcriptional regulator n=1 Tax=Gordonia sp. DT30 TaxID=3416546 RepID=UPI003CF448F7
MAVVPASLSQGDATGREASRDTRKRSELAQFLRSRRALISPADAGIAPGVRRRTPGLRREEVAQLAGVGITWYTWLEQGRPINVSAQVIDAVARVLRLDPTEHEHLYRLADVPGTPGRAGADFEIPAGAQRFLDALDPAPACLYDSRYNLLSTNHTYRLLFPGVSSGRGMGANVLWQIAIAEEGQRPLVDDSLLRAMVRHVRRAYGDHLDDPDWVSFIEQITAASPVVADEWERQSVETPRPMFKVFNCPPAGTICLTTLSYELTNVPGVRMVTYLPHTDDDAERIDQVRAAGGVRYE